MKFAGWPLMAVVGLALAGCGSASDEGTGTTAAAGTTGAAKSAPGGEKPLVAFAQANSADP